MPAPPSERGRVTPHEFITKWRASELKERSASQEHFIDLCRLLDEPTPVDADPTGETYCFERGARKDTGGDRAPRAGGLQRKGAALETDIRTAPTEPQALVVGREPGLADLGDDPLCPRLLAAEDRRRSWRRSSARGGSAWLVRLHYYSWRVG